MSNRDPLLAARTSPSQALRLCALGSPVLFVSESGVLRHGDGVLRNGDGGDGVRNEDGGDGVRNQDGGDGVLSSVRDGGSKYSSPSDEESSSPSDEELGGSSPSSTATSLTSFSKAESMGCVEATVPLPLRCAWTARPTSSGSTRLSKYFQSARWETMCFVRVKRYGRTSIVELLGHSSSFEPQKASSLTTVWQRGSSWIW
eukprot:scaffold65475_cov64-Phaeocystis_antarctica.AAC.4